MTVTDCPPTTNAATDRTVDESAPAGEPLPEARGPLSRDVIRMLRGQGRVDVGVPGRGALPPGSPGDPDFQLALWLLHLAPMTGFEGVPPHRPTSLPVQNLRWYLQRAFEDRLRRTVVVPGDGSILPLVDELRAGDPPSGMPLDEKCTVDRLVAKAPYLAWEADPHTLALARVEPSLKTPLAEIQAGEYGVGHGRGHAELFRASLAALGITVRDALERAPAEAYAFANTTWLFGGDRRLRGAALGQLCLLELDSVRPCTRAVDDWNRHGLPDAGRRWYDVHVVADEEHARIIRERLVPAMESCGDEMVAEARWGAAVTHEMLTRLDAAVRGLEPPR